MCSMSLDRTLSGDSNAASGRLRSHHGQFRPKSRRAHWYAIRSMCNRKVRLNDIYFNHQGKCRAEEQLVNSLAHTDPPKSANATQQHQQPSVNLSKSLPATFPSASGLAGFVLALPSTTKARFSNTPFRFSFDGRSQH